MQALVGIIERGGSQGSPSVSTSSRRGGEGARDGHRSTTRAAHRARPGLAADGGECSAVAALERRRAAGPPPRRSSVHGRHLGQGQLVLRLKDGRVQVSREPLPEMPAELKALSRSASDATFTMNVVPRGRPRRRLQAYRVEADPGMVVLDLIHRIQATQATDLAVRWNCKAGKCGSCSAEIDGKPRLMCMTRMDLSGGRADLVAPIRGFRPSATRHRRLLQLRQASRCRRCASSHRSPTARTG